MLYRYSDTLTAVSRSGLRIDTADPRPLWRQVEEGLAACIAAGALAPGAAVPSVRELAQELRINPGTVARAYQRLVDRKLLETRRGDGTYVVESPPVLHAAERRERLIQAAARLADLATALGASPGEAYTALDEAFRRQRQDVPEET
ncbi:MAG: GntR family transcriptional regulator [Thermoanaerobaculia bacterium]|nr:MAG: GntR family transcriptional regulator [Thermoanaerobaculia bacterium]